MTKNKFFNCGEMGHFARNCPKPRENANLARENEQSHKFAKMMDFGDNSVSMRRMRDDLYRHLQ